MALPVDPGSVSRNHLAMTICNSNLKASDTHFLPPWVLHAYDVHTYIVKVHKISIFKEKKEL